MSYRTRLSGAEVTSPMEGVTGMMARLSHMQRVAVGGSAMYRTRVFFSFRVRATVATSLCLSVSSES